MQMLREVVTHEGIVFEAWPEHGCWYQRGHADQLGALHMPMGVDGRPVFEDLGEVEVRWEDA